MRRLPGLFENRGWDARSVYVVPTVEDDSRPCLTGWDNVTDFILSFSKDVSLAGGYLDKSNDGIYHGCLGGLHSVVKEHSIDAKFVRGACFTYGGCL